MSRTRQARPPPVKATPAPANLPSVSRSPTLTDVDPIPSLHHYMQKYAPAPVSLSKDLPSLPSEVQHPAPMSEQEPQASPQMCPMYRASSVYSRPETSWERPTWWGLAEEQDIEHAASKDVFTLPATVYRDEASRKLEGIEPPTRVHSPIIPEPSPSPREANSSPAKEEPMTLESRPDSIPEEYDRERMPLPPTPQSNSSAIYNPAYELNLASSPPRSPDIDDEPQALGPAPPDSTLEQTWYDDNITEGETSSVSQTLVSNREGVPSTDSLPRGRTRQRHLPSYFHREQNYARNNDERAIHLLPEPISHTSDAEGQSVLSDKGSSAPSHGTAKSEAMDLLQQRKAKTLSEAYHRLLIEQYQDLAAEGRAWEAFADPPDMAAIDEEADGRDIRLIPEPLFFLEKAQFSHDHEDGLYGHYNGTHTRNKSSVSAKTKAKGGLSSFKAILPAKLRRNDSSTSGDIPISPPLDIFGNGFVPITPKQSSPTVRKKPWARKKSSQGHIPPLPLALPKSVANASRRSRERSAAQRAAPRRDSPHLYAASEEVYPRPMERAPAMPPTPETPRLKTSDILQAYAEPSSPQTPPDSAGSGRSWSLLDRISSKRRPAHGEEPRSGGSFGSTGGWYSKAKDSLRAADKVRRQHELKKSIRFVGQADPRNVETLDDTTRRLAYAPD